MGCQTPLRSELAAGGGGEARTPLPEVTLTARRLGAKLNRQS